MHNLTPGFGAGANRPQIEFHLFAKKRLPQACFETHVFITLNQGHPKRGGNELLYRATGTTATIAGGASSCTGSSSSATATACTASTSTAVGFTARGVISGSSSLLGLDVFALFDLGDMLGHGGISANAVGVHEADQFGLGKVTWGGSFAVNDVGFGGFEGFMQDEFGKLLAAFPFLVRVDIKVIPLKNEQAVGEEVLLTILNFDGAQFPFRIVRTASEKAAHDKFINAPLVITQRARGYIVDRVDRRMGLVVIAACAWLLEPVIEQAYWRFNFDSS